MSRAIESRVVVIRPSPPGATSHLAGRPASRSGVQKLRVIAV